MSKPLNVGHQDEEFAPAFRKALEAVRRDEFCENGAPHYALCVTYATLQARALGLESVDLYEFGVAGGDGLIALAEIASKMSAASGVGFRVFGFDGGTGMPPPGDVRDHPELFHAGQYPMRDRATLETRCDEISRRDDDVRVELVIGDVAETVPRFMRTRMSASSPVGFVVMDLDYYSSTMAALECLKGDARLYLPATMVFLDDIETMLTYNSRCGELAAINAFNEERADRLIERSRIRRSDARKSWHDRVFTFHVLDHPARQTEAGNNMMHIATDFI